LHHIQSLFQEPHISSLFLLSLFLSTGVKNKANSFQPSLDFPTGTSGKRDRGLFLRVEFAEDDFSRHTIAILENETDVAREHDIICFFYITRHTNPLVIHYFLTEFLHHETLHHNNFVHFKLIAKGKPDFISINSNQRT